jgi:hypothetical protein
VSSLGNFSMGKHHAFLWYLYFILIPILLFYYNNNHNRNTLEVFTNWTKASIDISIVRTTWFWKRNAWCFPMLKLPKEDTMRTNHYKKILLHKNHYCTFIFVALWIHKWSIQCKCLWMLSVRLCKSRDSPKPASLSLTKFSFFMLVLNPRWSPPQGLFQNKTVWECE